MDNYISIKKETPLITIIIPVYNTGDYLPQCLESITTQTYQNLEIIIINDGSTDKSGAICDRFAQIDKRIHVLHTDNSGLSAARNRGIDNADGIFLLFVDSDDWIEPATIDTLFELAVKYEAKLVCAKRCLEYEGKSICSEQTEAPHQTFQGEHILSAFVDGLFGDTIWNKLYHRSCFSNIRFPEGHNHEDLAITWKLIMNLSDSGERVIAVPDILFHQRMRKSSISNTKSVRNITDQWRASIDKYEGLSEYKERLVPECISVIGSMWINYCSFSKEDRICVDSVIAEMQCFSKKHYHQVMRGSYPVPIKLRCLASQSNALIVLWVCHVVGKVWQVLRNKKYKMFE